MAGATIPDLTSKAAVAGADETEIWDSEASAPNRSKRASYTVMAEFLRTLTQNLANKTLTAHKWVKGADLGSADPLVLGSDGNYFDVTGTTGFALITVAAGTFFLLQFDGALVLTHHTTNLDLPGEANITTAAGDVFIGFAAGANQVQCLGYTRADGTAVAVANESVILHAQVFS